MADNLNFKKKLMGLPGNLYNFACRLTADRDTFCCFVLFWRLYFVFLGRMVNFVG